VHLNGSSTGKSWIRWLRRNVQKAVNVGLPVKDKWRSRVPL
jgi:hypothetical protein